VATDDDVSSSSADGDQRAVDRPADDQSAPRRPHAILRYTTLRVALFVLALIVLWLVRIRDGVLLVAIALVLSGLASFVLLAAQRDAMSAQLHEAAQRRREKAQLRAAREDVPDA
jgi:hypothetical protein